MSHVFKVCTACVHCKVIGAHLPTELHGHNCTHPHVQQTNLVTGEPIRVECCSARMSPCGADGKFWTPKEGKA